MLCWLLWTVGTGVVVEGIRVDTGGRPTSLYRAQGPSGRNNVIITAKPQIIRSGVDLSGFGFPTLDCDPSHPCSQSFSVNSQGLEQVRGLGATSSFVDPDIKIQQNGHTNPDREHHSGLFSVIEDTFYKTKHGIAQRHQRPETKHGNGQRQQMPDISHRRQRPAQQVQTNKIIQPPSMPKRFQLFSRPEFQDRPAYSSILDSRIGVVANNIMDFTESEAEKEKEHVGSVSVASSHGRVKGPNYPFRPTQPPATVWTSRTHSPRTTTEPPAQLFATPDVLADDGAKPDYYAVTLRPDKYDPFS